MEWKQKLAELGLTETTVSKSIKAKIKDFYTLQDALAQTKQKLENPSDDDEIDELEADLNEYQESIEICSEDIYKSLESWDKNKDVNAERVRKMKEAKDRKAQQNGGGYQEPKAAQGVQTASNKPTPTAPPIAPPTAPPADNKDGEKKKSGFGWMAFTLLAGVVTLGAWWTMKNDD